MDLNSNSLLVIIPAYNEEGSVGEVVRSVRDVLPGTPVVVIDDGSLDGTPQVARQAGAELLRLPHHLGLGGAVQTGYKFAFEHGYECVVRVDSDGQHNAADIPVLLRKLHADGYDMVTGSRFLKPNGYRVQPVRRLGGLLFSLVLYPILGKRITDPTSGFAAVNRRALEVFSRSFPLEYPEIEALVVLQRKALRFCEVPVQMFPRRAGRSTIGSLQAMYYMIRVLLGVLVNVIKYERRFHSGPRALPASRGRPDGTSGG
ncbi:MAG TPA: glycosyltransferase family 2 protein [Bryobacterales bacterium]|nr:glycosyltransferase family 2 protein [Bryobacterales bacterium]